MKTKQKLEIAHVYSNVLEDMGKMEGLFGPERLKEILAYLDDSQFSPAILQSGKTIPQWFAHNPSGQIFNEYFMG